jgi:hypothetical protein
VVDVQAISAKRSICASFQKRVTVRVKKMAMPRGHLCALYLYASEGVIPGHYDASMMAMGWKPKKAAN